MRGTWTAMRVPGLCFTAGASLTQRYLDIRGHCTKVNQPTASSVFRGVQRLQWLRWLQCLRWLQSESQDLAVASAQHRKKLNIILK